MPIGKNWWFCSASRPQFLDSNPYLVAAATGQKGGIDHRAVQSTVCHLGELSAGIRKVHVLINHPLTWDLVLGRAHS